MLSAKEREFYDAEGYLVLKDFAGKGDIEALISRAKQLMQEFDPEGVSSFSTESRKKIKDDYFLKSANNISFFLEDEATDESGNLLLEDKTKAVNKIGHALHDLDPIFASFSRSAKMCSLLKSLGYRRPLPVQSMYICKQPKIGGYVKPHRDNYFLYTKPLSTVGVWLALEDATLENGCLHMLPGSHRQDLPVRLRRGAGGLEFEETTEADYDLSQFVPVPVEAGAVVVLHGSVVHYSQSNRSDKSRHAYSLHLVEGTPDYPWEEQNWLQRDPEFPFAPLY